MNYTLEQVKNAVKSKGYVWFEDENNLGYDVNIVAIRNSSTDDKVTNLFDDAITISFKENGEWKFYQWACTTDPGRRSVLQYQNSKGVAILVPNQYRSSHTIRLHQGKYEALGQHRPVKVYRDNNRDMIYDEKNIDEGLFGINIHRSNPLTESTVVDGWSAGCTVFKRVKDFNQFMSICRKARDIHGNSFTYTLIESKDLGKDSIS